MNPVSHPIPNEIPVDGDLAEQAVPGHGVPSQDPSPAAQTALTPSESERESNSALMGGGSVAGMATGAALGIAVGGPIGAFVGGAAGAIVGALGAAAAGQVVESQPSSHPVVEAVKPIYVEKS